MKGLVVDWVLPVVRLLLLLVPKVLELLRLVPNIELVPICMPGGNGIAPGWVSPAVFGTPLLTPFNCAAVRFTSLDGSGAIVGATGASNALVRRLTGTGHSSHGAHRPIFDHFLKQVLDIGRVGLTHLLLLLPQGPHLLLQV